MADISREKLRKEITAILKNADLTKTSAKKVRQQLEEKLGVDLAEQKKTVDELVMEILQEKKGGGKKKGKKQESDDEDEEENGEEANEEDEDEEEDESEEETKKKKAPKRAAPKKKKKGSDSDEGSDEEGSDDDYSPKKKKPAPKKGGRKKKKGSDSESDEDWGKKKAKKRGGGGATGKGYTRPYTLSPELAKLMGQEQMPRHEVVKKIWAIIKERNLYDPKNKQYAICDDEMLTIFGTKRFRIFGMMKFLKSHFTD